MMICALVIGGMGIAHLLQAAEPIPVGTIVLKQTARLGDTVIEPGRYRIRLVEKDEGMFIQIVRKDQVVAEDLAIVQPARRTYRRPLVDVTRLWRQEFIRIRVFYGEHVYKMVLETVQP